MPALVTPPETELHKFAIALMAARRAGITDYHPTNERSVVFSEVSPVTWGPAFFGEKVDRRTYVKPLKAGTAVEVLLDPGVVVATTMRFDWAAGEGPPLTWLKGFRSSYSRHRVRVEADARSWSAEAGGRWVVVPEALPGRVYDWADVGSGKVGQCWRGADGAWFQAPLGASPVLLEWVRPGDARKAAPQICGETSRDGGLHGV